MSNPASHFIDRTIDMQLTRAFEQIYKYAHNGYCTVEDATMIIATQWDEAVLESWREWLGEDDE